MGLEETEIEWSGGYIRKIGVIYRCFVELIDIREEEKRMENVSGRRCLSV